MADTTIVVSKSPTTDDVSTDAGAVATSTDGEIVDMTKLSPIYKAPVVIHDTAGDGTVSSDLSSITLPSYLPSDNTHPYDTSNCMMRIFYKLFNTWQSPIFRIGSSQAIQPYHIWSVPSDDAIEELERQWDAIIARRKSANEPLTARAVLWELEGSRVKFSFFLGCIFIFSSLLTAVLIAALSDYFEDEKGHYSRGVIISALLLAASVFRLLGVNFVFTRISCTMTRVRSVIMYVIYRKALYMSLSASQAHASSGKKMNMISNDAEMLSMLFGLIAVMAPNLIFIFVVGAAMIVVIGPAALVGWLFMILLSGPAQMFIGRKIARAKKKFLAAADARVKFINELIQGIRITKLYAWEMPLMEKVEYYRREEMKRLLINIKYLGVYFMLNFLIPQSVALLTFATYIALGNELTVTKVFTIITMIQLMRISIRILPYLAMLLVEGKVGLQRIDDYLKLQEKNFESGQSNWTLAEIEGYQQSNARIENSAQEKVHILVKNATFSWTKVKIKDEEKDKKQAQMQAEEQIKKQEQRGQRVQMQRVKTDDIKDQNDVVVDVENAQDVGDTPLVAVEKKQFSLSGMDLKVPRGQLVALVGSVGSGKSSLINAMLGEMALTEGMCHIYKDDDPNSGNVLNATTIGYCAQTPYVINTSLKENILFGLPYNQAKYLRCVEAAALASDIEILPNGDQTQIGERGINLSGGQKARVAFARALYRSHMTDLFLLDDPLSAVDINVGNIMFHEGVCDVLEDKTRVIVMNSHLHLLKFVDLVVVMDKGQIVAQTDYDTVMKNEEYSHLLPKPAESEDKLQQGGDLSPPADETLLSNSRSPSPLPSPTPPLLSMTSAEMRRSQHKELRLQKKAKLQKRTTYANVLLEMKDRDARDAKEARDAKLGKVAEGKDDADDVLEGLEKARRKQQERDRKGKLMLSEERAEGKIGFGVIREYFEQAANTFDFHQVNSDLREQRSAYGVGVVAGVVVLALLSQAFVSASDVWLTLYSEEQEKERFPDQNDGFWLGIWSAFVICLAVVSFLSSFTFGIMSVRSSMNLHMKVLYSVLRAPVLYFDSTPAGRILNRFSKDTLQIDSLLPQNGIGFTSNALTILAYLILICVTVPYTLIVLLVAVPLFYKLQKYYRTTTREVKRIQHISRTPIFSQFSESLNGLDTIRSYQLITLFKTNMKWVVANNAKIFLQYNLGTRWFNVRLEFIVVTVFTATALAGVLLKETSSISTALITLAVVYAYSCTGMLNWTIRNFVDLENDFTAVERLVHYQKIMSAGGDAKDPNGPDSTDTDANEGEEEKKRKAIMKSEAPEINFDYRPPMENVSNETDPKYQGANETKWPENGEIVFKNLKMRYRYDLDLVLKGLNAKIQSGEKIGICGRTGAGKSSLLVALFRLVEPEAGSQIIIDGVDCCKLGLRDLRSNLSIIPQDPVLFSGTIRFNLDPFSKHTDAEIWDVLKAVKLIDVINNDKTGGLECVVTENGSNFSQGQKQLICFARALLKNSKVLLLDEATSSIDQHTDKLIQGLIRQEFKDKTVLCIAHRLETILDYDRIMVLSKGDIIEFDKPDVLLDKENSVFASMVHAAKHGEHE